MAPNDTPDLEPLEPGEDPNEEGITEQERQERLARRGDRPEGQRKN
jgi:hypothetical protein